MAVKDFDDENLPKVNPNESLETISSVLFRKRFPVQKFEIRSETMRDKGIDFHIELKKESASGGSVYTNYRFAVQLKATNKIKQGTDGSFGLQISTSNISYLLNNGMPAYYVFYHHPSACFYFENVKNILDQIKGRNGKWQQKAKQKIYFTKILSEQAVQEIYEETYASGVLLRRINSYRFPSNSPNSSSLLIDSDNIVYSVSENIEYIDKFGADLVNAHRFDTVIEMEKRSWPRNTATPRFYLFCGIAYFQRGDLYKAMDLLKSAKKYSDEFDPEGRAIIEHTILNTRYLLDIISKEQYDRAVKKIGHLEDSGSFFQIENAFEELSSNSGEPASSILKFYESMQKVIENEKKIGLRIIAFNKIIDAESSILFSDLAKNSVYVAGRVQNLLHTTVFKQWLELEKIFRWRLNSIVDYAENCGYFISIGILTLAGIKWEYQKAFHLHYLSCWKYRSFDLLQPVDPSVLEKLRRNCDHLDKLAEAFEQNEYRENMLCCMILKYEILQFSGNVNAACDAKEKILEVIDAFEFEGLRKEYEPIFNQGTSHENFVAKYTSHMNRIQDLAVQEGIDCYRMLSREELAFRPRWSIRDFPAFDFSIMPHENEGEKDILN
ncbi:DUF4365 domain-containing protein [Flavobacterium johnsoniae]|uniref:DUF4365 domain-containing protein n=1 Tax=Flavobacterium TaxID=237 RepID=UPI000D4879D4|nr:DUF4365 domain-containing protein [Flavobacterium johnsoniae]PTT19233.1 hypothetical protein DBR27_00025 [Flavobacterium sp. HMWF030]WJS93489.1 DUF4365 domain-containing protein [Flavobacterium johnsoniae]